MRAGSGASPRVAADRLGRRHGRAAALATLPLVSMAELGFVVAFGVLLDSVIVRSLLLPALAYDLGRRMPVSIIIDQIIEAVSLARSLVL
ncbi:MAG TPA: MMPL family transporter [Streptosporangiaceae bacterium]